MNSILFTMIPAERLKIILQEFIGEYHCGFLHKRQLKDNVRKEKCVEHFGKFGTT